MTGADLRDVSCVVIHHRHFPTVLQTLDALLAAGLAPGEIVVVDNSEDPALLARIRAAAPSGIDILNIPNAGYGNAANHGIARLAAVDRLRTYVLIATHEARPRADAVLRLRDALDDDRTVSVAGPTLIDTTAAAPRVWSLGGRLTPLFNHPRHIGSGLPANAPLPRTPQRRAWVDGAFCLYRSRAVLARRFREDFFLYYEETDLHARLRGAGEGVLWVPGAVVQQSTDGTPPYLLGRNLQMFQDTHGTRFQRVASVPAMIVRRWVRRLLRGGPRDELHELVRGWRDGRRRRAAVARN